MTKKWVVFINSVSSAGLKYALVAALIPCLAACAPGMHGGSSLGPDSASPSVKPVLKTISPQLIQTEKEQREQQPAEDLTPLIAKSATYRIGSGDILSIIPWNNPELVAAVMASQTGTVVQDGVSGSTTTQSAGFVVDDDGLVQFPYVGTLKFGGLTVAEARSLLTSKLAQYYKKPDVSLRIHSYRSKRIYIDGDVKITGTQTITDIPMTLLEAINRAGGILPTGDQSHITVLRAGKSYPINLPLLLQKGIVPTSILLVHGDVVRVRSRNESKVFVLGEVTTPKALAMYDGRLTLNDALGEAGGLNVLSANGRQVYVIRNAGTNEPIVYHLDARSPVSLALAENFQLKAKDVVYVDAAALATWSRVINLILPSTNSLLYTYQAVKP